MELFAYIMVLISAFAHAYWNFVLKRAGGTQVFIGLSKIAEIVLFIVPFGYFVFIYQIDVFNYWVLYVLGAALVILNYIFLGRAYKSGDLSMVYPVSRAGALLFLPVLAYALIGEKVDIVGIAAISLIVLGLLALQLNEFRFGEISLVVSKLRTPATIAALMAAFTTACYTLWDKHSISLLHPFVYFYAYTLLVGLSYAAFILVRYPFENIKHELKIHKYSIVKVGFLNTFTYLLVLYSLQTGKASYVIALRQLSITFGAFLGWKILRETFEFPKKVGVAVLLGGCLLISLAR